MKKLIAMLLLLGVTSPAWAIDPSIQPSVTLNCAMPVEREDGSALALNEIAEIEFSSSIDQGTTFTQAGTNTVCQIVIDTTVLADNTYYYAAKTRDIEGRRSTTFGPTKIITIQRVPPPKPPTWL